MKKESTFEEDLKRLEEIVGLLDESEAPLDEMIKLYEEGMTLTKKLRQFLDNAELKVQEIGKSAMESED